MSIILMTEHTLLDLNRLLTKIRSGAPLDHPDMAAFQFAARLLNSPNAPSN